MSLLNSKEMTKNKQKINYIVYLLLVALVSPVEAIHPIREAHTAKDDNDKTLVNLFKISGLSLEIVKYIGHKGRDGLTALHSSAGLGHLDGIKYLI